MNLQITRNGIYITSNDPQQLQILNKAFTIRIRLFVKGGMIKTHTNFYRVSSTRYLYPRFGIFQLIESGKLNIQAATITNTMLREFSTTSQDFQSSIQLKDYQQIIHDHIMNKIFNNDNQIVGTAGTILKVDTGAGKTFISSKLMETLHVPTLIIVHNTTQLADWVEILTKCFPKLKIGQYSSTKKVFSEHVMVMVINSALQDEFKFKTGTKSQQQLMGQFGFVIFDEIHKYCSSSFRKVFTKCQAMCMLGLSATPEHLEGIGDIAVWNVGKILDANDIPKYERKEETFYGTISIIRYYGPELFTQVKIDPKTNTRSHSLNVKQIAQDPYRNLLLCFYLAWLLDNGKNVYVFDELTSHLCLIERLFSLYIQYTKHNNTDAGKQIQDYVVYAISNPEYDPNYIKTFCDQKIDNPEIVQCTTDEEYEKLSVTTGTGKGAGIENLKHAAANARVILTTYSYMGTGKSIPRMDAIIFATPKKNRVEQYVGRILRPGENQGAHRYIIDIVDAGTSLKSQLKARSQTYETQEEKNRFFTIHESSADYTKVIELFNNPTSN